LKPLFIFAGKKSPGAKADLKSSLSP
jgi:hypothetical protein